jgi:hypothetical protein
MGKGIVVWWQQLIASELAKAAFWVAALWGVPTVGIVWRAPNLTIDTFFIYLFAMSGSIFFLTSSIKVIWQMIDFATIKNKISNDLPFIAHRKLEDKFFEIEAHLPINNLSRMRAKINVPVQEWSLGTFISQHGLGSGSPGTIMPFQSVKMMTVPIKIKKPENGNHISGKLAIKMQYGVESEEEHQYIMRYNVYINFSSDGELIESALSTISL